MENEQSTVDVEDLIRECIPGGDVCDPQQVADAIRAYAHRLQHPASVEEWRTIESAPRGSGEDGPSMTTHPDYVAPPKLLLWTAEGIVVGYYDWYYHPGYGAGAEPNESVWRDHEGGRTYGVTHWMPLPPPPLSASPQPSSGAGAQTSTEQALDLYVAQEEALRDLLDKYAPHTTGNLQTRLAEVFAAPAAQTLSQQDRGLMERAAAVVDRFYELLSMGFMSGLGGKGSDLDSAGVIRASLRARLSEGGGR